MALDTYITPLKYILNEYSFTFYYQIIFYILDHFHTKNTKLYAQTRSACVLQVNVFNWGFFCVSTILLHNPSLNTQSCIRGISVVRDFCFRPFGQPGQCWKKIGPDYEQLLRAFFSCFREQKKTIFKKSLFDFFCLKMG